jgi:hypothetical protein
MKTNTKTRTLWLGGLAFAATVVLLYAQAPLQQSKNGTVRPFWQCHMPSGSFIIPLDRVSNISTHQYVVQGAGRVWEIVLADGSSSIARFYYMETASELSNPVTGDDTVRYTEMALEEVSKETDSEEVWRRVVKEYPHATHAHTVEYRFQDRLTLNKVFQHLRACWMEDRAGEIEVGKASKS